MQRYLCIFDLAGTNKVIPAEPSLRHFQHMSSGCDLLRSDCGKRSCGSRVSRPGVSGAPVVFAVPSGGSGIPEGDRASAGGLCRFENVDGDPGAIRTRDPQIRNLMLYPAELRGPRTRRRPGALTSAPCGETYVSRGEPAIAGVQVVRGASLLRPAIGSTYLAVRSKVDAGCIPRKWTDLRPCSRIHQRADAVSKRGRGECVYS